MKRDEQQQAYAHWLSCVPGIGNHTIRNLLQECKTPWNVYCGGEKLWKKFLNCRQMESMVQFYRERDPLAGYEELQKRKIRFVWQEDPDYPDVLRTIPDAPFALYVKGELPPKKTPSVAVIGARDCSEYGRYVACELGGVLGAHGIPVISGMARGIDCISQKAAINEGGLSFGVLGSGVDVCYPRENRELYERLCVQGGVLSIYPPGTEARPQNFPPRNRIVSGLADVLVVIEARSKSGTLITVDMALEQGREVYVVPGRVTDRLSDGCNRLLKQGAGVFLSPDDFLQDLESLFGRKKEGCSDKMEDQAEKKPLDIGVPLKLRQLSEELQSLYRILDLQPKPVGQILTECGEEYTVQRLTALLMRLCMEELAIQITPGCFARKI